MPAPASEPAESGPEVEQPAPTADVERPQAGAAAPGDGAEVPVAHTVSEEGEPAQAPAQPSEIEKLDGWVSAAWSPRAKDVKLACSQPERTNAILPGEVKLAPATWEVNRERSAQQAAVFTKDSQPAAEPE